jgi:hypothetical protein
MGWQNQNQTLVVVSAGTGYSGFFIYSPSPGPGNLLLSITAPGLATDPYGNTVVNELALYGPTGAELIQLDIFDGNPFIGESTGRAGLASGGQLTINTDNIGLSNEYYQWFLLGPQAVGHTDHYFAAFGSNALDGSGTGSLEIIYSDTSGNPHEVINLTDTGGSYVGSITATEPGTSGTTLAAETWHTATSTTFTGSLGYRYRLEGTAGGVVRLSGNAQANGAQAAGATVFTLPSGYRPVQAVGLGQSSPTELLLNVSTGGVVTTGQAFANGNFLYLDGLTFPLD